LRHFWAKNQEIRAIIDNWSKICPYFFLNFNDFLKLSTCKYFVLDEKVAVRDPFYINRKENIDFINTEEYLKFFLSKLNKREINSLIKKCKSVASENRKEDYLTSIINENLIYSEYYAEPIELILNYTRSLYKHFYWALDNKHLTMELPFLSVNHLEHKIEDLYYNNSFGFTINYLRQAIDISYSMQMAQDVRLLKICNFCKNSK